MEEIKYKCSKCGNEKNEKQMFKSRKLTDYCNSCRYKNLDKEKTTERIKRYRENNKEKLKDYYKKYYKENPPQSSKKYYKENSEKCLEYAKKYYEKTKEQKKEKYYIRRFKNGFKIPDTFEFKYFPNPSK